MPSRVYLLKQGLPECESAGLDKESVQKASRAEPRSEEKIMRPLLVRGLCSSKYKDGQVRVGILASKSPDQIGDANVSLDIEASIQKCTRTHSLLDLCTDMSWLCFLSSATGIYK